MKTDRFSRTLARLLWDFERFGLIPPKWPARFRLSEDLPKVLIVSIPKSGTHLVERVLCLHPVLHRKLIPTINEGNLSRYGGLEQLANILRRGQILVSHLYFSTQRATILKAAEVKIILMVRDPRDIAVSRAFYISQNREHEFFPLFAGKNLHEQIMLSILGDKQAGFVSLQETLSNFIGWKKAGGLIVRFEDLINEEAKMQTIHDLYEFLGIRLDLSLQTYIAGRMVSAASPTFRKGKSGQWQKYFDEETSRLFYDATGDLVNQYDYGN